MAVYALLVGIDRYPAPIPSLYGARNDVVAAERWLLDSGVPESGIRMLQDGGATRAAVLAGFAAHLGQAGKDDTALFWFAGHGSEQPVPSQYAHLEPSGLMQTMVCADSRSAGGRDLADKELRVLASQLAERGAHVVLVIDCCHSESSSRLSDADSDTVRVAPRRTRAPEGGLLPELASQLDVSGALARTEGAEPDHVNLSACRYYQTAKEVRDAEVRGVFSLALTVALHRASRAGSVPTYRELLTSARCYVENRRHDQQPVLYPDVSAAELADQPFLGGQAVPNPAPLTLRWRGGWEIDAGSCHGIVVDPDYGDTRVAVAGRGPLREARVVEVRPDRSSVVPIGWQPDLSRQYPVVVSALAQPAATAVLTVDGDGNGYGDGNGDGEGDGGVDGNQAAAELFLTAARTAGPGGGPSAHVRIVDPAGTYGPAWRVQVRAVSPGAVRVIDSEHSGPPLHDLPCTNALEAAQAFAVVEHMVLWRRIRALENPASELAGAVELTMLRVPDGVRRDTGDGDATALRPGPDGAITLDYSWSGADWEAPRVFLRLRNRTGRRLYCVLLNLTDRYGITTDLFPGGWIGPGRTAFVHDGTVVKMRLPADRPVRPGERTDDWLKVLISPEPLNAQPFRMPPAGSPSTAWARGAHDGVRTVLESFGRDPGASRVAEPETMHAAEWATLTIPVSTGIPARMAAVAPQNSRSLWPD